jgi:hypothetical protein
MSTYLEVVPAYGRDYKSQAEVKAAWASGKDFLIQDLASGQDGRYVNKDDAPKGGTMVIRYAKLMKVMTIKV